MPPFLLVYIFKFERHLNSGAAFQDKSKWFFSDCVHVWFSKTTAFWGTVLTGSHSHLNLNLFCERDLAPRGEMALVPHPNPPSPQQTLQRKRLQARSGVEVMFDLKATSVSPARLVGLCWCCSRSRAMLRHDTPSEAVCSAPRTMAERGLLCYYFLKWVIASKLGGYRG